MNLRLSSFPFLTAVAMAALLVACGDDETTEPSNDATADAGTDSDRTSGGDASSDDAGGADGGETTTDTGPPVPEGPQPAAPRTYSGGECPTLEAGTNSITSRGESRTFDLYLPDEPEGAGLTFAWHGAGDSAANFGRAISAQAIADNYDTVVIVPNALSPNETFAWQIVAGADNEIDLVFFDDMLSCAVEQYGLNTAYVYTTGFSAGALWSTYLVMNRAPHLAAAVIFSGGVSNFTFPYTTPANEVPVILTHGGPSDQVVVQFSDATEEFGTRMANDGSIVFVCNHNRGHTIPQEAVTFAFPFMYETRFGVVPEEYQGDAPPSWPSWCERRYAE